MKISAKTKTRLLSYMADHDAVQKECVRDARERGRSRPYSHLDLYTLSLRLKRYGAFDESNSKLEMVERTEEVMDRLLDEGEVEKYRGSEEGPYDWCVCYRIK